jgi:cytochrome c2
MVSKQHCPDCGFLMMMEAKGSNIVYTCVNTHDAVIKDDNGLGPNLDILLEYLKRP